MKLLDYGWSQYSEHVKNFEADGSQESGLFKFCSCPIEDGMWSFGGWHMYRDGQGNETCFERCPQYWRSWQREIRSGGELLTYSLVADDPRKLHPHVQPIGGSSAQSVTE